MEYIVAMQRAIALAEKGLGKTAPNPIVGAVIIDSTGGIIAEGFHDRMNSTDHAEVVAIKAAVKEILLIMIFFLELVVVYRKQYPNQIRWHQLLYHLIDA